MITIKLDITSEELERITEELNYWFEIKVIVMMELYSLGMLSKVDDKWRGWGHGKPFRKPRWK